MSKYYVVVPEKLGDVAVQGDVVPWDDLPADRRDSWLRLNLLRPATPEERAPAEKAAEKAAKEEEAARKAEERAAKAEETAAAREQVVETPAVEDAPPTAPAARK